MYQSDPLLLPMSSCFYHCLYWTKMTIVSRAVCSLSGKYIRCEVSPNLTADDMQMTFAWYVDNVQMMYRWYQNVKSHETWVWMTCGWQMLSACCLHIICMLSTPPADDTALHKAYWLPCFYLCSCGDFLSLSSFQLWILCRQDVNSFYEQIVLDIFPVLMGSMCTSSIVQ